MRLIRAVLAAAVGVSMLLAVVSSQTMSTQDIIKFDVTLDVTTASTAGKAVFVDNVLQTAPVLCGPSEFALPTGSSPTSTCSTIVPRLTAAPHDVKVRVVHLGIEYESITKFDFSKAPTTSPLTSGGARVTRQVIVTNP